MQGTTTAIVLVVVALLLVATACGFPLLRAESVLSQAVRQAAADPVCSAYLCDLSAGSPCFEMGNSTYHSCSGTTFCDYGNYTCVEKYPLGHECTTKSECAVERITDIVECSLDESSGKSYCTKISPGGMPGDACTNNTDCKTNVCTAEVCQGYQENDNCTTSDLCALGLYCDDATFVCARVHLENENCTSSEECGQHWNGRECLLGKCQFPFQAKEGQACAPIYAGSSNGCGSGLYCDPESNSCKQYQRIECTNIGNDTECTALPQTSCICTLSTGSGVCSNSYVGHFSAAAIQFYRDIMQCISRHSCVIAPTSKCFMDNCADYFDCYMFEVFTGMGMDYDLNCFGNIPKCNLPPPDPSSSHHSPSPSSSQHSASASSRQHSASASSSQHSASASSSQHSTSASSSQHSAPASSDSGHHSPSASEHHFSESSSGNHSESESGQHSGNVSLGAKITAFDALAAFAAAAVGALFFLN